MMRHSPCIGHCWRRGGACVAGRRADHRELVPRGRRRHRDGCHRVEERVSLSWSRWAWVEDAADVPRGPLRVRRLPRQREGHPPWCKVAHPGSLLWLCRLSSPGVGESAAIALTPIVASTGGGVGAGVGANGDGGGALGPVTLIEIDFFKQQ